AVGLRWPATGVRTVVFAGVGVVAAFVLLSLLPWGPFARYTRIKQALAEQTDLRGVELDEASSEALGRLAREGGDEDAAIRDAVQRVRSDPGYAEAHAARVAVFWAAGGPVVVQQPSEPPPKSRGSLWPAVLAGATFLYLWWIAALVYDLTVAWHH